MHSLAKALHTFTKQAWPAIVAAVLGMTAKETDWALWTVGCYPQTLKALMKLDDFAGKEDG